MHDWGIGYVMGIASGLIIGFATFRKRNTELSPKEKKRLTILTIVGVAVLVVFVIIFVVR